MIRACSVGSVSVGLILAKTNLYFDQPHSMVGRY